MMMSGMLGLLMVFGGGGGNELLDYIPTKIYWQIESVPWTPGAMLAQLAGDREVGDVAGLIRDLDARRAKVREAAHKKLLSMGPGVIPHLRPHLRSDSPEVAMRVREIIKVLSAQAEHTDIRRLMAIRTLGEMRHKPAGEVLRKLTASKELFVADYARRAIAAIEGRPHIRPVPSAEQRLQDVWMLPKNCAVVGQSLLPGGGKPLDVEKMLAMAAQSQMEITREQLIEGLYKKGLLPAVYKMGNLRADLMTVALSEDVGEQAGFVAVIGRGQYDAEKARALLRQECPNEVAPEAAEKRPRRCRMKIGRVEVFCPDDEVAILLPSNELAVFLAGPRAKELPIGALARAVQTGKGALADNRQMAALIRSADRSGAIWGAAKMTQTYRKEEVLAPFGSMVLVGRQAQGAMDFTLTAAVQDAEKLPAAMKIVKESLAEARREIAREIQRMPMMKPVADVVHSIRIKEAPGKVTATARLKGEATMGLMIMPWLVLARADSEVRAVPPPPAKAVQVRPAPATRPVVQPRRLRTTRPARPKRLRVVPEDRN